MLGDFAARVLVLILGYAYPAFECFNTLEKKEVNMEQLRFWCQYWIIVAFLTVIENFSDALVSWLPMYSELKLAFYIYLWYPKTKGTSFIYETFLQPYVVKYEPELEEKLQVLRAKTADLLLFYIKNFTSKGQSMVLDVLHHVISPTSTEKNLLPGLSTHPPLAVEPRMYDDDSVTVAEEHAHRKRDRSRFSLARKKK